MARTTGNIAPAGFTAGQLRDGQSIGIFDWYNSAKFEIRVRYYQNKLIAEIRWQNNGNWGAWYCQARAYFVSTEQGHTSGPYTELNASTNLFATESEITALGIPMPGGSVPGGPSNALIPFKADADGRITVLSEVTDTAVEETKNTTQVQKLSDSNTSKGTAGTTGTGTKNNVRNSLIIAVIVSVVAVIGILIAKMRDKKKKARKRAIRLDR